MFELDPEYLSVRDDAWHPEAIAGVRFQRALRLPAGREPYDSVRSDAFHVPRALNDHFEGLDFEWLLRSNQHIICLTSSEAVTLEFATPHTYPFAVKVAIGTIDALSGARAGGTLGLLPQDYLALPCQNRIDSWCDGAGATHDFAAPAPGPLDANGAPQPADDESDCISITFVPMKPDVFQRRCTEIDLNAGRQVYGAPDFAERFTETHMLNARMRYELEKGETWDAGMVYPDPFDADDWDADRAATVAVTMVGPQAWQALTGEAADPPLFSRDIYDQAGVPWEDRYGADW